MSNQRPLRPTARRRRDLQRVLQLQHERVGRTAPLLAHPSVESGSDQHGAPGSHRPIPDMAVDDAPDATPDRRDESHGSTTASRGGVPNHAPPGPGHERQNRANRRGYEYITTRTTSSGRNDGTNSTSTSTGASARTGSNAEGQVSRGIIRDRVHGSPRLRARHQRSRSPPSSRHRCHCQQCEGSFEPAYGILLDQLEDGTAKGYSGPQGTFIYPTACSLKFNKASTIVANK